MLRTFWRRERVEEETPRSDRDVQIEQLFPMVCSALDETFSSLQRSALLFDKKIFLYDLRSNRDLRFKPYDVSPIRAILGSWDIAHTEHTYLVTIRRLRIDFSGTPPPPPPYRGPSRGTPLTSRWVQFSAAPAASYLLFICMIAVGNVITPPFFSIYFSYNNYYLYTRSSQ